MSIYDKSSLVLIPSGTKTSKVYSQVPTNGDGDFDFTRSTAATRIAANGNIEKETSNLFTYSNDLSNAIWQLGLITATSGQAGYDGSSDAWLITKDAAAYRAIEHDINNSGVYTYSVYAKANTLNLISLRDQTLGQGAGFNLTNGTTYGNSGVSSSIDSVGGGWYRCSVTFNGSSTRLAIYIDFDNATAGSVFVQDFQLEQGLVARDVITTTTTALYGGITDNTPRLDYTDSSCPALLLEPLRTNLVSQSEAFVDSSYWATTALDIVANDTTSPEGVDNASFLRPTTANSGHQMYKTFSMSAGTNTLSVFLKAGNYSKFRLYFYDGTTAHEVYGDCSDGSIHSTNSTTSVEDYGNGWYRYSVTATNNSYGAGNFTIRAVDDSYQDVWVANGTDGFYIYGWQFEAGSYPTSYIPTYGSSVSRVRDEAYKTGVSSLIGQTEGTLFVDVKFSKHISEISDGTSTNRIVLYTDGSGYVRNLIRASSVTTSNIQTNTTIQAGDKIALAYSNNDSVIYKNGVQIGSDTSVTIPATSKVNIGSDYAGNAPDTNTLNQTLLFKTRLSNAELAALTTI